MAARVTLDAASHFETMNSVADLLIFRPRLERRADGIFVHLVSITEPPPSTARAFVWQAGPFATEATALEALRRKLRVKMQGGVALLVEVGERRFKAVEPALRALADLPAS